MIATRLATIVIAVASLVVGCGNEVLFQTGGAGGRGSAREAASVTTNANSVVSSSALSSPTTAQSTGSGIPGATPCERYCSVLVPCGADPGVCVGNCEGEAEGHCDEEWAAYHDCAAATFDQEHCNWGLHQCDDQLSALGECSGSWPCPLSCDEPTPGTCSCAMGCPTEDRAWECVFGEGTARCTCWHWGELTGECEEELLEACEPGFFATCCFLL